MATDQASERRQHRLQSGAGHLGQRHRQQDQQRPDQVVLLLDGKRPEMLYGGRRHRRVGVREAFGQPPVQQVGRPGDDVAADLTPPATGHHQEHEHRCRHQHHVGRRQQPLGPAGVEAHQRDPAGPALFGQQLGGDEIARDDEEDVDADEAAGQRRHAGMEQHHRHHGDRADSLDVATEPGARPVGRAGVVRPADGRW
ncbi:hypothetical protein QLR68_04040 [Micromonospora sp. DH15]|nr:hypothetical protein [Micromonospora sp. DH15]